MSKFNEIFSDVVPFTPEGYYLSKSLYSEDEAIKIFNEFFNDLGCVDSEVKRIECGYVRFQATPEDLRSEGLGNMAWVTCESTDRNAQECWAYGV